MRGGLAGRADGRKLRVGIIGTGFIGEVHAHAARRNGARVVAVAASTPASTDAAVGQLGAERGESDGFALVAASDLDVVHICTPNNLHHPLAAAAVEAGKHVVCEKPLTVDVAGAGELHRAATQAGVVATVPFVYRFYPMVREARARIGREQSPLRLLHGAYLQDWLSTPLDHNWRVDRETSGPSRAFADIGSHWCDLVEFVTGDRLASVSAELVRAYDERVVGEPSPTFTASAGPGPTRAVTTEDAALVMFRTARGSTGSVVISQISTGHKNQLRFELTGETTSIAFDQEHPDELWVGRRTVGEIVSRDAGVLDPAAARYVTVPPGHPQGYQDCFDAFVGDTYRAIAEGSAGAVDGLPTFGDGARAVRITAAVLRSANERAWVDVEIDSLEGAS